jgi:hypothetical protein
MAPAQPEEAGRLSPFLFWPRMPMLYVIQKGYSNVPSVSPGNIVYCVTSVADIIACQTVDFIFTDGHAFNGLSSFFTSDRVTDITQIIDLKAIHSKYWTDSNGSGS